MVSFQDYAAFYRLAKNRVKSNKEYIKFENFQSQIVIKALKNKGVSFKGKKVLDVGCGRGGYSQNLLGESAHLTALDIIPDYFQNVKGASFVLGDAVKMPLKAALLILFSAQA